MAWDHALLMQTPHNIYLFKASFYSKYFINIVKTEFIKAREGEGFRLSQLENTAEATSPVKYKEEEQEDNHSIHCE
jgi:hypothetical protein